MVANASAAVARFTNLGSGSTLPGRLALALQPQLIPEMIARKNGDVVLITGTNGKTMTAAILAHLLGSRGSVCANRSGANLYAGIATALLDGGDSARWIILEVDEATAARVATECKPRLMIVTNVSRDQLDRYGELRQVKAKITEAVLAAPEDCTFVLNADDPGIVECVDEIRGRMVWYGFNDDSPHLMRHRRYSQERTCCPRCGAVLELTANYYCLGCGLARPSLDVTGRNLLPYPAVAFFVGSSLFSVPLAGVHNAYNALAAIAAASALDDPRDFPSAMHGVKACFGRNEIIRTRRGPVRLTLTKNPASFHANIASRLHSSDRGPLLIALNDLAADGRDVSWIWDVDFEVMAHGFSGPVAVSGRRYEEMRLRLKYAGITCDVAERHSYKALNALMQAAGGSITDVFATYTAMLDIRRALSGRGFS